MTRQQRRTEHIKNGILVVLFFVTILLLYFQFKESSRSFAIADILPGGDEPVSAPSAAELLAPSRCACSDGGGVYYLCGFGPEDFSVAMDGAARLCADADPVVSEITEEQYKAVCGQFPSVQILFDTGLPFRETFSYFGAKRLGSSDSIGTFTTLAFSDGEKESFFVISGDGKFYRILADHREECVSALRARLPQSGDTCYYAGDIIGGSCAALMPIETAGPLAPRSCSREDQSLEQRTRVAENVFGDTFDFVRRIADSFGNITYLYGYGQRSFRVPAGGGFEYRQELSGASSAGFFDDLEAAVAFVSRCGGWDGLAGGDIEFRLTEAREGGEGRGRSHIFGFSEMAGGVPCASGEGPAIEIEVLGGQIVSYRRNAVVPGGASGKPEGTAADAANVIAGNCNYIYNTLQGAVLQANSDEAFGYVSEHLADVRCVYFRSDGTLVPAWEIVTSGGGRFCFDLYTAQPLGYTD